MLIKYRFKSIEPQGEKIYAVVDRLADLLFFDTLRSPTQKAWDEKHLSEDDCRSILESARSVQPQTGKSGYVIQEMEKALSAIAAHKK